MFQVISLDRAFCTVYLVETIPLKFEVRSSLILAATAIKKIYSQNIFFSDKIPS